MMDTGTGFRMEHRRPQGEVRDTSRMEKRAAKGIWQSWMITGSISGRYFRDRLWNKAQETSGRGNGHLQDGECEPTRTVGGHGCRRMNVRKMFAQESARTSFQG